MNYIYSEIMYEQIIAKLIQKITTDKLPGHPWGVIMTIMVSDSIWQWQWPLLTTTTDHHYCGDHSLS